MFSKKIGIKLVTLSFFISFLVLPLFSHAQTTPLGGTGVAGSPNSTTMASAGVDFGGKNYSIVPCKCSGNYLIYVKNSNPFSITPLLYTPNRTIVTSGNPATLDAEVIGKYVPGVGSCQYLDENTNECEKYGAPAGTMKTVAVEKNISATPTSNTTGTGTATPTEVDPLAKDVTPAPTTGDPSLKNIPTDVTPAPTTGDPSLKGVPGDTVASNTSTETDSPIKSNIKPPTLDNGEILKRGSKGEKVRDLQDFLISNGYMEGSDLGTGAGYGTYGPRTEAAVKKYQNALLAKDSSAIPAGATGRFGAQTSTATSNFLKANPQTTEYANVYNPKTGTFDFPQSSSNAVNTGSSQAGYKTVPGNYANVYDPKTGTYSFGSQDPSYTIPGSSATQGKTNFNAESPAIKGITGRATHFGYKDNVDNGEGWYALNPETVTNGYRGINTDNTTVAGVALPETLLRETFPSINTYVGEARGATDATKKAIYDNWAPVRNAAVKMWDPNDSSKKAQYVPIVDIGLEKYINKGSTANPKWEVYRGASKNVVIDQTEALRQIFPNEKKLSFQIVPDYYLTNPRPKTPTKQ